jgi:hypothetical protein
MIINGVERPTMAFYIVAFEEQRRGLLARSRSIFEYLSAESRPGLRMMDWPQVTLNYTRSISLCLIFRQGIPFR